MAKKKCKNSRIEDEERKREANKGSHLVFMYFNRINIQLDYPPVTS